MESPLVSVIIPVYNGSDYVGEAINSVISQTYSNIEIIVINDGSNDCGETEKTVLKFGNNLKYYYKENGGVASALNYGISKMLGKYFVWLSHDDLMHPQRIEKQVRILEKTGLRIAICSGLFFSDEGIINTLYTTSKDEVEISYGVGKLIVNEVLTFCGVMLEKTIFDQYGLFDETLLTTQDVDMLFRIIRNERYVCLRDNLYRRREHSKQGTKTIGEYTNNAVIWRVNCIKQLTEAEMINIQGSVNTFLFAIMYHSIMSQGYNYLLKYCVERMEDISEYVMDNKPEEVWIYGAGVYGKMAAFGLRCYGIKIKGYLDRDRSKAGREIYGIRCYEIGEYNDGIVLVAGKNQEEMEKCLIENGISSYWLKKKYDNWLLSNSPSCVRVREALDLHYKYSNKKISNQEI